MQEKTFCENADLKCKQTPIVSKQRTINDIKVQYYSIHNIM